MTKQGFNDFVNYQRVNDSYLKRRQLQGSTDWVLLSSLGVGAVISGDFYGWNFGLTVGGFWGLFIATCLMAGMYICMVYSIAELSAAFPYAGGFYSFTRSAFGPLLGFICGVAVTIEYVLTPAVILVGITSYLHPLIPAVPVYLFWLLAYTIFVAINIRGAELSLQVSLFLTLLALAMLGVFYMNILVTHNFRPELLFNVPAISGQSETWLPKGWYGIFAAIPYAIWFYLAIEQVPLAAEETRDVAKNIPRALIIGIFILITFSLLTLVINSGTGGGAAAIGKSSVPIQTALESYLGKGSGISTVLTAIALMSGLLASFHAVIYAYGRILFSLSRAGYIPRWISVTSKTHTPDRALILGAIFGFICAVSIDVSGGSTVGAALLNMAVFAAVISYVLVMFSYIKLKLAVPDLPRPYNSPLGLWGAVVGSGLAILAFLACFFVPEYRPSLWGILCLLAVAIVYFFLYSRKQLVAQAPEEMVSLKINGKQF
ncbi:MAG TPA: ethanolamine permease [Leptolyngbyaceae cyanobacterium]